MVVEERVHALAVRWLELREEGIDVPVEELCVGASELCGPVRKLRACEKIGYIMVSDIKNKWSAGLWLESETACHVVGDGEPSGNGLDLFDASNR